MIETITSTEAEDARRERAENNERAVYLSEELAFLERMLEYDLPADAVTEIRERRTALRAVLSPDTAAHPDDGAVQGIKPPGA